MTLKDEIEAVIAQYLELCKAGAFQEACDLVYAEKAVLAMPGMDVTNERSGEFVDWKRGMKTSFFFSVPANHRDVHEGRGARPVHV